ncbi:MAG: NTP transferase domain-containing protein [Candidatus Eisenbacteria bacterium]|nr:NTP transferase domain-containing protein [Candidatus Eisenbacteria bacterium]
MEQPGIETRPYDLRGTLALILAGGVGSRLNVLVRRRAKPAVPFGGIYRIIDFALSNVMNSGIERVGILTQYMPYSLTKHLGRGEAWGLTGRSREVRILPPHTGTRASDWYQGTADAVYRNLSYIGRYRPEITLVLSGDHIYRMDYAALIEAHIDRGADATLAVREIPIEEAHQFGTVKVDGEDWVTGFEEKPPQPTSNLISMGVYAFRTELLVSALEEICESRGGTDFAKDLFPFLLERNRLAAYRFGGYWQDVGTVRAFFDANMELLDPGSPLDLPHWGVRTNLFEGGRGDHAPAFVAPGARVRHATLARGCRVRGDVSGSVLSPGVIIEEGARVRDSIIMHEGVVQAGAVVEQVVADKQVVIGRHAHIGDPSLGEEVNRAYPRHLDQGLTLIGKGAILPERCRIGRNCCIFPGAVLANLEIERLPSGETVEWEER